MDDETGRRMDTAQSLDWLQAWYFTQCDGDWEHGYGIHIETLDNPGWNLCIDLLGTELEHRRFEPVSKDIDDDDWFDISRSSSQFVANCGPTNLSEVVGVFRVWAKRQSTQTGSAPVSAERPASGRHRWRGRARQVSDPS